jgi:hypothetical protein
VIVATEFRHPMKAIRRSPEEIPLGRFTVCEVVATESPALFVACTMGNAAHPWTGMTMSQTSMR